MIGTGKASVHDCLDATAQACLEAHERGDMTRDEACAAIVAASQEATLYVIQAMVKDGVLRYTGKGWPA